MNERARNWLACDECGGSGTVSLGKVLWVEVTCPECEGLGLGEARPVAVDSGVSEPILTPF